MARDAAVTRRSILDAAIAEFSQHGIAGARIDRIAERSGYNKAMIYRYFGNKEQLFDAVFEAMVIDTMNDVPIDAEDLPEYAARLYDRHCARIEPLRIAEWDVLERDGAGGRSPAVRRAMRDKVAAVSDAQQHKTVRSDLPPAALLNIIIALSRTGVRNQPPDTSAAQHRNTIVAAVARLTNITTD